MSFYAYKDELRTQIIYATETTAEDKSKYFFCENPECNARLHLDALNSEGPLPYFAARKKNFKHVENCFFESKKNLFVEEKYDENLFNFDELVNEYLNGSVRRIPNRLYTLSQIYRMCKSKNIDSLYNNISIWKILCDCRSNHIYTKGIYGAHLIECKALKYDPNESTVSFKYPINDSLPNKYDLKVIIDNKDLFNTIKNLILTDERKITKRPIIIIGNWQKNENYYVTSMATKTQLYVQ